MTTAIDPTLSAGMQTEMKTTGKAELDQADFMTLFITQLQYQDPMEPMDSNEMASQLAEFSNMEATMKMADNMEKLLEYQTSQNNLQLLTLLDKDVRIYGNGIGVTGEDVGQGEFILEEDAEMTVAEIYDSAGRLKKIIDLGRQSMGSHALEWDGTDMLDKHVEDGAYSFQIKAYSQNGQEIAAEYRTSGKVTGVDYETGSARLVLDNYIPAEVAAVIGVI